MARRLGIFTYRRGATLASSNLVLLNSLARIYFCSAYPCRSFTQRKLVTFLHLFVFGEGNGLG